MNLSKAIQAKNVRGFLVSHKYARLIDVIKGDGCLGSRTHPRP